MIIKSELRLRNSRNNENGHIHNIIKPVELITTFLLKCYNIIGCTSLTKPPRITMILGGNLEAADNTLILLRILIILFFDSMVYRFHNRCTNSILRHNVKNCMAITVITVSVSITMMAVYN